MDQYICSNPPSELYRIQYSQSHTTFSTETGFKAKDTTTTFGFTDETKFTQAIEKHFTWGNRDASPFISLFSNREHAENWGCKEPWNHRGGKGDWALCTISTDKLEGMKLFKLSDLVEKLQVEIPERASQHIHGAYICLYGIPASAIIDKTSGTDVASDRDSRRESAIDMWDYLGECGDNDSHREMMQENYNTIIEKNIEGGW
ncbi:uncharacterized protein KY384_000151 [Bacidia gigantensis]|uniref:uncharacterized protein n=1 Tax=Bacidia gigantensis TaxID=2732470 RepID=UPI001D0598AF|nr:uncharacterized protein KY384_000151 [Bacidia gigantensis]KAG8526158.1 hypothetical protein KY384_000151 [Bacidia gigantensis]